MEYITLQVMTGQESKIAEMIDYTIQQLWKQDNEANSYLAGVSIVQPASGAATVSTNGTKFSMKTKISSYIWLGFKEWRPELYHIVKKVPGVLSVLEIAKVAKSSSIRWDSVVFTSQEEIDYITKDLGVELCLIIPETTEADEKATLLKQYVANAKQWLVFQGKRAKRVLALPYEMVQRLLEKYAPHALDENFRPDIWWCLRWIPEFLDREKQSIGLGSCS